MPAGTSLNQEKRRRTARPKSPGQLAAEYPISVIIPAHNAVGYLSQSLPALLENDLSNLEIVLVDDHSTDDLAGFVQSVSSPVLRVVEQASRQGPGAARNRGISESSHPYLLFLDADVVLPRDSIHWIRETLDIYRHRPEVAGVLGTYSQEIDLQDFYANYKNLYTCHLYRTTETLSPYVHTAIFCIRREVMESVGGFASDLDTVEDFRLGLELGSTGRRFVIDWRVAGRHLKPYTLRGILQEDSRRIRDLMRIRTHGNQKAFSRRAHRWSRLMSVILPAPILVCLAAAFWFSPLGYAAGLMALVFVAVNWSFFRRCRRRRGWGFAIKSAGFLFLEMLWAEWCLLRESLRRRR